MIEQRNFEIDNQRESELVAICTYQEAQTIY